MVIRLVFTKYLLARGKLYPINQSYRSRSLEISKLDIQQLIGENNWPLANYQEAWARKKFLLAFANSTLVAIAVTAFVRKGIYRNTNLTDHKPN